ncbi:hypothetical protein FACUT_7639 [Fusarium acutatum]|uniref:Uncharacterized protein n=1 Tax=Fusarium acutatum TaxID=78861 RepID=A0A8H4JQ13_9HYPO|nr:hypothetical protein FACUT_7639 [Fusarium acutatum]
MKHVSDTDVYKRLELTRENTYVDLIKALLSDLDSQIRVVKSRAHFEQKVARAFDEHNLQYGYRVKAPANIQFFADWKRFCQDHQVPPAPGTTVDKVHSLPQIIRRALINQYHPRGDSPMDPEVTKELLHRKDNLECTPLLVLFDTRPYIREFQLKGLRIMREMMEDAGINVEKIAASMGEALAILHFECEALGLVCFALGASPAYEAWKFEPLEIGIHIPSFYQLLEAREMSVEKISHCLGDHTGVIPSSPEYLDQEDEIWQSFRTAYIKRGNACRTKDSLPTPGAVMEHFESLGFEMEEGSERS